MSVAAIQLIFGIGLVAAVLTPHWMIFKKAGFPRWWSLLMIIPLVNLLVLDYVAFAKWPRQEAKAQG